jgi:hypothetical protein
MTTPARITHPQVLHHISRQINYNDQNAVVGQQVGVLPAGAILDKTMVQTSTAFNGTVSVALSVGTTLTGTDLINGTDVRTAAARVDTVVPIAKAGPLLVDTPIYASIVFGGTVGTAGVATVAVTYIPAVG